MTKIAKEEVLYVAGLARLDLDPQEIDTFAEQLESILAYMETLERVNTEGVPPTSHAIFLTNAFREDTVSPHLDRNLALDNAPQKEDGSFIVPKIIP